MPSLQRVTTMNDPRAAPPEPQTHSEQFNVPGVLRMLKAEAAAAYTGERTKIELVSRLVQQQHGEIEQLRASLMACTNALKAYTPGDYGPGQQIIRQAMQLLGEQT